MGWVQQFMFLYSGSHRIFRDHAIKRIWLDINAGRTHVATNVGRLGRDMAGVVLGAENEDFFR